MSDASGNVREGSDAALLCSALVLPASVSSTLQLAW